MERKYLITHEGNFYKANLHSHSTFSDGVLTPEQAKELYKSHGYSVYAYTDHVKLYDHRELTDPDFLVLVGYELGILRREPYWKTCHLCAISRDPDHAVEIPQPKSYDPESINRTIARLRDNNYIVNYNHPGWSAEEASDFLPLDGITAMEIYNHGCEVLTNDGDAKRQYEIALKHGKRWFCIATDDNHDGGREVPGAPDERTDSLGGWTMIKAPELTYDAIIKSFDAGNFYCSTGPEIYDLYIEDGVLHADCSPVSCVYLKSDTIGASKRLIHLKDDITHVAMDLKTLKRDEWFVRLELVRGDGKTAWTNPYYLPPKAEN